MADFPQQFHGDTAQSRPLGRGETPTPEETSDAGLAAALVRLSGITTSLRAHNQFTFLTTAVNILSLLIMAYSPPGSLSFAFFRAASIFVAILCFGALAMVARFEALRKKGDVLFEEISDELQWHVRAKFAGDAPAASERPSLEARIVLREFARASDLSLIPGQFGPAIYAALNLMVSLAAFIIFKQKGL